MRACPTLERSSEARTERPPIAMTTYKEYKSTRNVDPDLVEHYRQQALEEMREFTLQQARKQAGMTQNELAEHIGVSQVRVSALERGRVEDVVVKTLQQYARALGGTLRIELELGEEIFKIA